MIVKFKCFKCNNLNEFNTETATFEADLREANNDFSSNKKRSSPTIYIIECNSCGEKNRVPVSNHE